MTAPRRLRDLSALDHAALLLATAAGAAIRLWYQYGRCFDGDEVGTLLHLERGYGELLTTFRDPWLTMNAYIAGVKALSQASDGNPWVMLLPTLLAGFAIVPLVAALALRLDGRAAALGAAALTACNPFLVGYGVQLRSYMLLAAATTAALVAYLDWTARRAWRAGWHCALATGFAVLMHANGVYFVLFLVVLLLGDLARAARGRRAAIGDVASLLVPLAIVALPVGAAYWPLRHDMAEFRAMWSAPAPTSLGYAPWVIGAYLGRGVAVLPSLLLLGWCGWDASRRRRRVLWAAVGVIVPATAASWLGVSHFPWAYARFFIAVVPLLLVLIAAGAARLPGGAIARGAAIALVLASWTPRLLAMRAQKRDQPWARVAAHLRAHASAADLLLTTDDGDTHAALDVRPYLDPDGARFGDAVTWLRAASAPARVVLVNANAPLAVAASAVAIGATQIVVWEDATRAAVVDAAITDLERVLDRRVAADLSGAYRVLLELRTARGRPDDGTYTALRYECLMRTRRQRYKPPQLLGLAPDADGP